MERIRDMDRYQKGLLLLMAALAVVFAGIYAYVTSQVGFLYNDQILKPSTENGNTLYSAEVHGVEWCFTVTPDKTVTFRHGSRQYGPYTARLDSTAIPEDHDLAEHMNGVEVREQDRIIFRGGIMAIGQYGDSHWMMYDEDGSLANFTSYAVMSDGTMVSGNGTYIDPMEPSVSTVLRLMQGPELTHKGVWYAWFAGFVISLFNAVSILFADELFRWNLIFRVRNVEAVEPSDWEIGCRYVGWTLMAVFALVGYVMGLQS